MESGIIRNAARCRKCGTIIESTYRHDFVTCPCGAISVDGGAYYLKRTGNPEDVEELSERIPESLAQGGEKGPGGPRR